MKEKLGIIGCGNMGSALASGIVENGFFGNGNTIIYDTDKKKEEALAKKIGAVIAKDESEVAEEADYLILAIKPGIYPSVLDKIAGRVKEDSIVIVIAVGISFDDIYKALGDTKVVRLQPSTPALVGESDTTLLPDKNLGEKEIEDLITIFKSVGTVEVLEEALMDVVPALASSAPAYTLMLISAMADAGVKLGFPRDQAIRLSAQSVLGAAKLALESEESPDDLKNNICTPGGTTIEAVVSLENDGFRSTVINAVDACAQKALKMLSDEDSSH